MNTYPLEPGWRSGSTGDTAQAAAEAVKPLARTLETRCLALVARQPLTPDEAHAILDAEEGGGLPLYSVRPRFSALAAKGLIADSGERRLSSAGRCRSIVWRLTTTEERALAAARRAAGMDGAT